MAAAVPIWGDVHELTTICVGKNNFSKARSVFLYTRQSCPGERGGMSFVSVSYTSSAAAIIARDELQQFCMRLKAGDPVCWPSGHSAVVGV